MPYPVAVITRTQVRRPRLLERAVRSIMDQTFDDWIHVIVNDGGSPEILEKCLEPFRETYRDRLKILHQASAGMQPAANAGIAAVDSTFISIHDDDDAWEPTFLEKCVAFLTDKGPESNYQGVISKSIRVMEKEGPNGDMEEMGRDPYIPLETISLDRVGYENPFPPIAFLYRREALNSIGPYNPRWDMAADLDFNFRFLQRFDIGVVREPLALYYWRSPESSNGHLTNTVTAQKEQHARLLSELKNHYLRSAKDPASATAALSFLISHFSIENQWMTAETRDHSIANRLVSEELKTSTGEIHAFLHSELWTKITSQLIPAQQMAARELESLNTAAGNLHKLLSQTDSRVGESQDIGKDLHSQMGHLSEASEHLYRLISQNSGLLGELNENQQGILHQIRVISELANALVTQLQAHVQLSTGHTQQLQNLSMNLDSQNARLEAIEKAHAQKEIFALGRLKIHWNRKMKEGNS